MTVQFWNIKKNNNKASKQVNRKHIRLNIPQLDWED